MDFGVSVQYYITFQTTKKRLAQTVGRIPGNPEASTQFKHINKLQEWAQKGYKIGLGVYCSPRTIRKLRGSEAILISYHVEQ